VEILSHRVETLWGPPLLRPSESEDDATGNSFCWGNPERYSGPTKVTGLSRPDAGLGNRALVAEGHAVMIAQGTYRLPSLVETAVDSF
jgi:hypothetical protein